MLTLFITSAIPPAKMDDDNLANHIKLLFLQIKSNLIEMEESWNKPSRESLNEALRAQLIEMAAQLSAAQSVYEFRQTSMR